MATTLQNNIEKAGKYINAAKAALNNFVRPENPCPEVAEPETYCSSGEVGTDEEAYQKTIADAMIACLSNLHDGVTITFNKDAKKYLNREIILHTDYKFYRLSKPAESPGSNSWRKLEKKGPETSIYTKIHAALNINGTDGVIVIRKSDGLYKGNIVSRLSGGGSAHEYIFTLEESKISLEPSGNPQPHNNASLKEAESQRNNALKELATAKEAAKAELNAAKRNGVASATEALRLAKEEMAAAQLERNVARQQLEEIKATSAATAAEKAATEAERNAARKEVEDLKAASQKQKNNATASSSAMNALTAARQASLNNTRRAAAYQTENQGLLSSVINTRTAAEKAQAVGAVRNSQGFALGLKKFYNEKANNIDKVRITDAVKRLGGTQKINNKWATWKSCFDDWGKDRFENAKYRTGDGMCSDVWADEVGLPRLNMNTYKKYKAKKGGRQQQLRRRTQKQQKQQSKAHQQR